MKQFVNATFAVRNQAGGHLIGVVTVIANDQDSSIDVFQAPFLDPPHGGKSIDPTVREMYDSPHYYASTAHDGLYYIEHL